MTCWCKFNSLVLINPNEVMILAGDSQLGANDEVELKLTVTNQDNVGVPNVPLKLRIVDTSGTESGTSQIRLRRQRGQDPAATILQNMKTDATGSVSVFITRIAAGANDETPEGVTSHIAINVPIADEFEQELTTCQF